MLITRTRILPTVADLVARALADTAFLADLAGSRDPDLFGDADAAATEAAERWEMELGGAAAIGGLVPAPLIADAAAALAARGAVWLREREIDRLDALADAIQAGDIRRGHPVGYDSYRSAAR